jgi:hypothetical protein
VRENLEAQGGAVYRLVPPGENPIFIKMYICGFFSDQENERDEAGQLEIPVD